MSVEEVDQYLARLDEPRRSSLERLRATILAIVPEAQQGLSYGAPAFRVDDKVVGGFAAARNHLSYLPHSGEALAALGNIELAGLSATKGALRFAIDGSVPDSVVEQLITARRAEAGV